MPWRELEDIGKIRKFENSENSKILENSKFEIKFASDLRKVQLKGLSRKTTPKTDQINNLILCGTGPRLRAPSSTTGSSGVCGGCRRKATVGCVVVQGESLEGGPSVQDTPKGHYRLAGSRAATRRQKWRAGNRRLRRNVARCRTTSPSNSRSELCDTDGPWKPGT